MRFSKALPHMLRHSRAELLFDLSVFQLFAESLHGRDMELLVNAKNSPRIEPRVGADAHNLGTGCGAKFFKLRQGSRQYHLANRAADAFANACIRRQIRSGAD